MTRRSADRSTIRRAKVLRWLVEKLNHANDRATYFNGQQQHDAARLWRAKCDMLIEMISSLVRGLV